MIRCDATVFSALIHHDEANDLAGIDRKSGT